MGELCPTCHCNYAICMCSQASRRAAPKMGDSPAAPEDVASMLNHLRLSKFSIDRCIADVLEATVRENGNLATRNRALEGAIEEHNKRWERECCGDTETCREYHPPSYCPRYCMIDTRVKGAE